MILYRMVRDYKDVAQVVTLDSGKCIVSWPTSVVVYDSEDAARAVHITHMGGRGEPTKFIPVYGTGMSFVYGMNNAAADVMEGCWFASLTNNYTNDEPTGWDGCNGPIDEPSYIAGYGAYMDGLTGAPWRPQMDKWVADQKAERARRQLSTDGLHLAADDNTAGEVA